MSKKSRISSTKRQTRASVASTAADGSPTRASSGGGRLFEREFNPDYAPVIMDLKRIGVLAGTFFVILIALSFFLK